MPKGSEKDENEDSSIHLVGEWKGELVAACRLQEDTSGVARLRYMCTNPAHQGMGFGLALLSFAEKVALENLQSRRMILDAREVAAGFYAKAGYEQVGEPFEKVGIPHWHMAKNLG